MNKLKIGVLIISLSGVTALAVETIAQRGRISRAYHRTHDRLSRHKGKVGLACGAVGAGLAYKVFHAEFDSHVKPLIKSVWKRFTGWCKRIFRRDKKN